MNQKEIQLYVSHRSWRCWQMRRLLKRRGYHFELIDTTDDPTLRGWLAHFAGRESMPYVFVDHRPVGGLGEIKALEHSGALEHLVRGEV
jgi:glutaredoxin